MRRYHKVFISSVVLVSIIFNFNKILSFTEFWMLVNDTSANVDIVNDTQEEIRFVNMPNYSTLNSFYTNLFYTNACGKIASNSSKTIIYPFNEENNLLVHNGKEYLFTNLKYEDWATKKKISNFNLHSINKSNEFGFVLPIRRSFGLKLFISSLIFLSTIFTIGLIYLKNKNWWNFVIGLLLVLALIHSIFLLKEILYFKMLYFI